MSLPELCVKRRSVHEDEKGLQGVSVDGCAEISFLLSGALPEKRGGECGNQSYH